MLDLHFLSLPKKHLLFSVGIFLVILALISFTLSHNHAATKVLSAKTSPSKIVPTNSPTPVQEKTSDAINSNTTTAILTPTPMPTAASTPIQTNNSLNFPTPTPVYYYYQTQNNPTPTPVQEVQQPSPTQAPISNPECDNLKAQSDSLQHQLADGASSIDSRQSAQWQNLYTQFLNINSLRLSLLCPL